jgi:hypothetical protein
VRGGVERPLLDDGAEGLEVFPVVPHQQQR